jgi:hypothetical protein
MKVEVKLKDLIIPMCDDAPSSMVLRVECGPVQSIIAVEILEEAALKIERHINVIRVAVIPKGLRDL